MGELLQSTYSVGLKGVKPENVAAVESLILETIDKVVAEGFTDENIASSMNTIEFQVSCQFRLVSSRLCRRSML